MIQAYKEYWGNMTLMNATATRSQYWWPQLVNLLILGVYSLVTNVYQYIDVSSTGFTIVKEWNGVSIIFIVLTVLIWVANFTVRARRLHDRDHSNWWILFYIIPIIGSLIIFITSVLPSKSSTRWVNNQSEF